MKFYASLLVLTSLAGSSAASFGAKIPTNLNDNVLTCGANARCSNKVMFGRTYKVIQTAQFTVMVSISNEGAYTRADVSIANNGSYSQNLSPQDFRVEVVSPKPKVLLYVPPSELQNLPAPAPVAAAPTVPAAEEPKAVVVEEDKAAEPNKTPNIDELYAAAKREEARKEAAEKEAAQKHLVAAAIPANEVVRGRVYFEKDPKAKQVNVVLPISGVVFEFPYTLVF
jgi:type IV secretory pathway VirB10-like protein